jgi:hypothetical protein
MVALYHNISAQRWRENDGMTPKVHPAGMFKQNSTNFG